MSWLKKKIKVPKSSETKELEAVVLWTVKWKSRDGSFHSDTHKECEAFPDEDDAKVFAEGLRAAFELIRHTSGTKVEIYSNKDRGQ